MNDEATAAAVAATKPPLKLGPVEINVFAWVYTTVSVMSMLVVYDGWEDVPGPGGIVVVVVGPTVALAAAHVFASVLDDVVMLGRRGPIRLGTILTEFFQYALVAVPPLLVLGITSLVLQQPPRESIRSMLILGMLSLGFWGGLAGWRSGLRGWRLGAATAAGLVIGAFVYALQLLLEPH